MNKYQNGNEKLFFYALNVYPQDLQPFPPQKNEA